MAFIKEKLELEVAEAELLANKSLAAIPKWLKVLVVLTLLSSVPVYYGAKSFSLAREQKNLSSQLLKARQSFTAPKSLKLSKPSITTLGSGIYAAAFFVTNENLELGLESAPYEIKAYNKTHSLVARVKGNFYILPNESKYIAAPRLVSLDPITSVELEFPETLPWKKTEGLPKVLLTESSPKTYNQNNPPAFVVDGFIQNKSPYQLSEITLVFLLKDKNGGVIGISQRSEFNLSPFERRGFLQLWPGIYTTSVAKTEIFPYTNVFDKDNIKAAPGQNPSTNLNKYEDSRQ